MNMKKDNTGIVSFMNDLLKDATGYHSEAQQMVDEYRSSYYNTGEDMISGNQTTPMMKDTRHGVVSQALCKDVMRSVEGAIPSLVAPFIEKDIATLESDTEDEGVLESIKTHEKLVNYQWNKKSSPLDVVERISRNLQIDGTAWCKTGWNAKGYPEVFVVPFESVIPDPNAYTQDEIRFVIHRKKVSISDILSNPEWYGKHTLDSLNHLSNHISSEYEPMDVVGRSDAFDSGQRASEVIEVFEYYGEFDKKGDGTTQPVVIIWSAQTLLNEFDSPYPGFSIPFDAGIYLQRPYSIYGSGVAELIGEHQTTRQEILRGIIDNMNKANNGQKFIKKGAFDLSNARKFMKNAPIIEVNHNSQEPLGNAFWDGGYNQIPPEVYQLMEKYEEEQENLSGLTKYSMGTDSRSLNQTATGVSIISSMSQRRLVFITQHISDLIARVLKKWILLNDEFIVHSGIANEIDLFVKAGTAGIQAKKGQDISNMLQALAPHAGVLDPAIITDLVADLAETFDLDVTAKKIRDSADKQREMMQDPNAQMQQQQEQQMMKQMAMRGEAAEISKDEAKAHLDNAKAQKAQIDAAQAMYQPPKNQDRR